MGAVLIIMLVEWPVFLTIALYLDQVPPHPTPPHPSSLPNTRRPPPPAPPPPPPLVRIVPALGAGPTQSARPLLADGNDAGVCVCVCVCV